MTVPYLKCPMKTKPQNMLNERLKKRNMGEIGLSKILELVHPFENLFRKTEMLKKCQLLNKPKTMITKGYNSLGCCLIV